MPINPILGKIYIIKRASGRIRAKFISERTIHPYINPMTQAKRRTTVHYIFKNLTTGRDIELKSRAKIIREWSETEGQ